jgi:hypothetical protein
MAAWKLTVRDGSDVSHESFEELDDAVARMRERALAIRAGGPAKPVSMLREFAPGDQVNARLQLSGGRWPRKAIAGVDVRGDGTFLPYRGGLRREELDPTEYDTPFDAVHAALGEFPVK